MHRQYFWVRFWIVLSWIIALAGSAAAFFEVETIIATGPILSIIGLFGMVTSIRRRFFPGFWISASAPAISLDVFLLILLLDWDPSSAQDPVPILGTIYTGILFVIVVLSVQQIWSLEHELPTSPKAGKLE